MIELARLRIEILSFWRCGTGAGRSAMLDTTCLRDRRGLPYVPGRHLKGLLRDAIRRLGGLGVVDPEREDVLFGQIGFVRGPDEVPIPRLETEPGLLAVESARLADQEADYFAAEAAARAELFRVLRSTAIDRDTRTARDKALRQEEVAVPMTLHGRIHLVGKREEETPETLREQVGRALALVRGVGAKRNRGLGRCIVSLEEP